MRPPRLANWRQTVRSFARRTSYNPGLAVPILVAVLMISASLAVSQHVLSRLATTQTNHFRELTGAYLDGLSTAILPYAMRRDAWETYDAIERARSRYAGIDSRVVLVVGRDERVLAASDPLVYPLLSMVPVASQPSVPQTSAIENAEQSWLRIPVKAATVYARKAATITVARRTALR